MLNSRIICLKWQFNFLEVPFKNLKFWKDLKTKKSKNYINKTIKLQLEKKQKEYQENK